MIEKPNRFPTIGFCSRRVGGLGSDVDLALPAARAVAARWNQTIERRRGSTEADLLVTTAPST
jgi:hypothetical protein